LIELGVSAAARKQLAHVPPAVVREFHAELAANANVRSLAGALVAELRAYAREERNGTPRPVGSRRGRTAAPQRPSAERLEPTNSDDDDDDLSPERIAEIRAAARAKFERHVATIR